MARDAQGMASAFAVYRGLQPCQLQQETHGVSERKKKHDIPLSQKSKRIKKKPKQLKTKKKLSPAFSSSSSQPKGLKWQKNLNKEQEREHSLAAVSASNRTEKATKPSKKAKKLKTEDWEVPIASGSACEILKKSPDSGKPWIGPSLDSILQGLGKIQNSKDRAAKLFEWMIAPISPESFFSQIWEKKPALIRRHNLEYYKGLFSTAEFDRILRESDVQFGVNLDVTSYSDGKRETHNPPGRALPLIVWDYYKNGCSLRMLNPQAFSVTVWNFLSILQGQFGSMSGANTYLTPAGSQGFAPHYDDIEAFVIQLEGKKHWRVYSPRKNTDILPQFSSGNFSQEEIGDPILETTLEAGDLLYFPRGFIHQGDCLPDAHSLHITVSSYQKNCWGDLLAKLLPAALQLAIEDDVEFRQGLPLDYLEYMGVQNSDMDDSRRKTFIQKTQSLIKKLAKCAPFDIAVDQKAKEFLHDCLPPVLTEAERSRSVHGVSARWENGVARDTDVQMERDTWVRLLRQGIIRICNEGDSCLLYYSTDNSRVYHKEEPKYFEIDLEQVDGIEFLIHSYPKYVSVDSLPCKSLDDKLILALFLFEKGLLITKEPLTSV
ncbi:ribosomal oxygenase 1 [Rhinatrema bivittatum]|uniref:ribosomal oxygenase 1 n=1 Tax=Rhinatrema bivittatum TaxID=194408 RepID=UPI00112C3E9B|nr:ribosomal oxygenase 1 [Rhinatrema bivittatum]